MVRKIVLITAIALVVIALPAVAMAADEVTVEGEIGEVWTYVDTIEISAYYPYEDSYTNNYKGVPLDELVGEIVAVPTKDPNGLLGKTVMLVAPDGEKLVRKVADTGCKPGRMDLLVKNGKAMHSWGLRDCEVWVLEEEAEKTSAQ